MSLKNFLYFGIVTLMFVSCGVPKDLVYISNAPRNRKILIENNYKHKIQVNDLLGITVSSTLMGTNTAIFNKGEGAPGSSDAGGNDMLAKGYLVDQDGEIAFPYLGKIKATGLTREELGDTIEHMLKEKDYVAEPVVVVNLLNFRFYTLGATGKMTANNNSIVQGERLTILQAIAMCGDLDIGGKRKNVTIIREQDGYREIGTVDLTSRNLFNSPYYYIAQNDIIYVEPNDRIKRQASMDLTPLTVVSSLMSFATTILALVYVILK